MQIEVKCSSEQVEKVARLCTTWFGFESQSQHQRPSTRQQSLFATLNPGVVNGYLVGRNVLVCLQRPMLTWLMEQLKYLVGISNFPWNMWGKMQLLKYSTIKCAMTKRNASKAFLLPIPASYTQLITVRIAETVSQTMRELILY